MSDITKHYLEDSIDQFRKMKVHAEKALAQVSDEEFFQTIDVEANSLALIVKHIGGNLLSRWTDFLTRKVCLKVHQSSFLQIFVSLS